MIKAASIAYAIFMALITALLCYGFVLLFSVNTQIEDHYQLRSELIRQRFSAQALAKAHFNELSNTPLEFSIDDTSGHEVLLSKQPWGFLSVVNAQIKNAQEAVSQHYLMGWSKAKNDPILYVRNNDEPLKISGNTRLEGTIFTSTGKIKKVTVNGQTSQKTTHLGSHRISQKVLPTYDLPTTIVSANWQEEFIAALENDLLVRGFDESTVVFEIGNTLENVTLKGNIVVRSNDTIRIKKSAILEDIIVMAPKVIFEKDFKGSLQAIASSQIETGKGVRLEYPSVLVVQGTSGVLNKVEIGEQSLISGAVIMTGQGLAYERMQEMVVHKDATVKGLLYCDGVLELYGNAEGTVFSSALLYKTTSTRYSNLLKDVTLKELDNPGLFFGIELPELGTGAPLIVKKV
ncbi:MAG: hypothetical protein ABJM06_10075 [Gilvibacter sp.]